MEDRDEAGRFAPGNRLWEARSTAGPKPKFANGEDLWVACCEYFEWVDGNPLKEGRVASDSGKPKVIPVDKMRSMTQGGLCVFLDIAEETWRNWRSERSDLSEVVTRVDAIIREQKFTGAAAGLLNPNIIARDLGLADRSEHTGKDGGPIQTEDVTHDADSFARAMAGLAAGSTKGGIGEADTPDESGS